jgi:hypothetical protein
LCGNSYNFFRLHVAAHYSILQNDPGASICSISLYFLNPRKIAGLSLCHKHFAS